MARSRPTPLHPPNAKNRERGRVTPRELSKEAAGSRSREIHVQRLGERIIISCEDDQVLNDAIRRVMREGKIVSIASWRDRAGITAIVTLKNRAERAASLSEAPMSRVA